MAVKKAEAERIEKEKAVVEPVKPKPIVANTTATFTPRCAAAKAEEAPAVVAKAPVKLAPRTPVAKTSAKATPKKPVAKTPAKKVPAKTKHRW